MARKLPLIAGRNGRRSNISIVGGAGSVVELLGAPIDRLRHEDAVAVIEAYVSTRTPRQVATVNLDFLRIARHEPAFAQALRDADLALADGMPLVWVAHLRGCRDITRVDGPTSMKLIMRHGADLGWRHYLYGGSPHSLPLLLERLQQEIPSVSIVGSDAPPFRDLSNDETTAALERINSAEPHFVWVGLGMPKQELWMARHQHLITAPVMLGVGAAFDFHAGIKRRAPLWMQNSGLEWLHRLSSEPKRLGRRYLHGNARFLMLVAQDLIKERLQRLRGLS